MYNYKITIIGAFGKVYKGLLKRTSEDQLIYTEVAIKSLKCESVSFAYMHKKAYSFS